MSDVLLIGHSSIDHQHQELLRTFQKLQSLVAHDDAANETLSTLTTQLCEHFTSEEAVMKQLAIPEPMFLEHELEHRRILTDVVQVHLEAMHGTQLDYPTLLAKVADWITTHIVDFDLALKQYVVPAKSS